MALTTQQYAAIKTYITVTVPALDAFPDNSDGNTEIAAALNALASPDFMLWNSKTPVQAVFDSIDWSKYTPTDSADNTATFTNRVLLLQTKQMNLQAMLIRETLDATKANIRGGLRDAVIQLPAGAGGAMVTAGGASGVTTLTACLRKGRVIEKILTLGPQQTGTVTADIPGYEGEIAVSDVHAARIS